MSADALKSVTSSAQTVRYFLSVLGDTPEKQQKLLDRTGLTLRMLENRKARISAFAELTLVENIGHVYGSDWVLQNANLFKPQVHGALGTAILSAPTIGDALDIITRFGFMGASTLFFEHFQIGSGKTVKRVLSPDVAVDVGPAASAEREIALIGIYHFLDKSLGGVWQGAEIWFQGPSRASNRLYRKVFSCPVKTEKNRCALVLPATLCKRANSGADKASYNKAVMGLYQMTSPQSSESEFSRKIKNYLASIAEGRPGVDEAARVLGVSRRTLNRRLQLADTSFRELLDKSLNKRARKLLSETNLSRAEISDRLGYNDQASFSRALKRWKQST